MSLTEYVPDDIRTKIDDGAMTEVEDAWLARVDSAPEDLGYFLGVGKALAELDRDMAIVLLQTLDDQLEERSLWAERIELLRRHGDELMKPAPLHKAASTALRGLYGDRDHFDALYEKVGLDKAKDDIPKTWKKVDRLDNLMTFAPGTPVTMAGKGAGTVKDVNLQLESFLIEFENGLELRVGFGGAGKLIQPLDADHILRRKLEAPETLEKLRDEDPSELLRIALTSEDRPLSGAEVKLLLAGIVPESRWTRWWATARKHPQVLADGRNKRAYTWAATAADADEAVWGTFQRAKPRRKLEILRRDAAQSPELRERMAERLERKAAKVVATDPGLAVEIWMALERADLRVSDDAPSSPKHLVTSRDDLRPVLAGVEDRIVRERLYQEIRKHRDDWQTLYEQALWQETDARSLDSLADALQEHSPELFEQFFDSLVTQPRKNPAAFTWLVERAADRPAWMQRSPLRLATQLLFAIGSSDFAQVRAARLAPLLESGGTLPRLLDHLPPEQAASALDLVRKSPSLEDYHREPLANAIQLRFPDLHEETEAPLYATPAQIAAKRKELKELTEQEIPENREAIESARELGDLRENFEYHAARRRHEFLAARAGKLDEDLRRVRPIDPEQIRGDEIAIGARVTFRDANGTECSYTILGPWESDPDAGILSNESELAQRLVGKKAGDAVELPDGSFTVATIAPAEL
ncbi:MAG: GreA/GreB family elongation factor [Acidobacteriota bacterium]